MYGECRYEEKRALTFRYDGGELHLVSASLYTQSWGMGTPAPHVTETDDFARGTISLRIEEHHEFNFDRKREEKMQPGCGATLAEIQANGYPVCAALQSKYMYQELFPEESEPQGAPTCPSLEGAYQCTWSYQGNPDKLEEQILVIHRVENKVHRYDVSSDNALITDGRTRLAKSDSMSKVFETATCRRERLTVDEKTFLILFPGDKRKPLFDREPWQKKETVWTQLDLEGKHFSALTTEEDLQDQGGYRTAAPITMDCVKQP